MATTNLGKVSVTPKGAWSSSNAYEKLDIVTNGGNGYIALKDVPSGTAITNTSYWLKFADKGDKGDTGEINGASASISGGYGSPSVSVTEGGTSTDRSFAFAFSNLKGNGIESIVLQGTSGAEKTYRITFSDGTHFDFVVTDGEVTEESLAETLEGYATVNGYFEDLTSGSTEEVISNVKITDQEPYTFRTSGGNAEIGSREEDTLVGVSVAFNQLVQNFSTDYWVNESGTTSSFSDGIATVTTTVNSNGIRTKYSNYVEMHNGHKYLLSVDVKSATEYTNVSFGLAGAGLPMMRKNVAGDSAWHTCASIIPSTVDSTTGAVYFFRSAATMENVQAKNPMVFDLTLAFGSDIADYLYTLERAQAGEGVALAKKLGLNKYLGYNAGTLYSAQTDAHKMTGFNQWDEEWESGGIASATGENYANANSIRSKNYIPVIPGATYYGKTPDKNVYFFAYDANKQHIPYAWSGYHTRTVKNSSFVIPEGVYYVRFNLESTTYDNDICISIHWDNSRDTDYEPYVLHNYPIDPVVLRGILKKDADGNIYADGDVYHNDGTVDRNMKSITFDGTELDTYWSLYTDANNNLNQFYTSPEVITDVRVSSNGNISTVCDKFASISISDRTSKGYGTCYTGINAICFNIDPSIASTVAEWKTWLQSHPVTVEYYTTEPATEQATPFTTPQIVDNWGTEEYPDYAVAHGDREYSVPMGHTTLYPISIRDKVEASADNPSNDGVYILQMSGGKATYIPLIIEDELPTMPTQDGTYTLKTVVSSGTATLSWVAE